MWRPRRTFRITRRRTSETRGESLWLIVLQPIVLCARSFYVPDRSVARPFWIRIKKTLPLGARGLLNGLFSRLGAQDVCRLKAFGALELIKLHGLSFVERAVAVLLDCGEVHEHILSRGALDEPISFRPVEPLDCSLLSHGKTPFLLRAMNLFSRLPTERPRTI